MLITGKEYFIKKLCSEELQSLQAFEAFTANILISLYKNLGLIRVGVEKVLRRIAVEALLMLRRKDFTKASGSLQLRASQEVLKLSFLLWMIADIDTNSFLLNDTENAFNSINCKVRLPVWNSRWPYS